MAVLNIKNNLKTSFGSFSIWDDFFLPFAASRRPPSSSFLMAIPIGQHVYILHTQDYKILIYTPQFSEDLIICLGSRQTFTMGLSKQRQAPLHNRFTDIYTIYLQTFIYCFKQYFKDCTFRADVSDSSLCLFTSSRHTKMQHESNFTPFKYAALMCFCMALKSNEIDFFLTKYQMQICPRK